LNGLIFRSASVLHNQRDTIVVSAEGLHLAVERTWFKHDYRPPWTGL